jgi:hypothetical protein
VRTERANTLVLMLARRINGIPSITDVASQVWGAPSGVSPAVLTEAAAETASPNASLKAQDFWVHKTGSAAPPADSIVVEFSVGG